MSNVELSSTVIYHGHQRVGLMEVPSVEHRSKAYVAMYWALMAPGLLHYCYSANAVAVMAAYWRLALRMSGFLPHDTSVGGAVRPINSLVVNTGWKQAKLDAVIQGNRHPSRTLGGGVVPPHIGVTVDGLRIAACDQDAAESFADGWDRQWSYVQRVAYTQDVELARKAYEAAIERHS